MSIDKHKTPSIPPQDGRRVLILHHFGEYLRWTDARWVPGKTRAEDCFRVWDGAGISAETPRVPLEAVVGWTDIPDVFNLTGTQKPVS